MSNKRLKGKFNDAFEVVQKIINEWDPLDLLALYCPDDEYESEIQLIVFATLNKDNADKLAKKINEILYKAFEDDFKKSNDQTGRALCLGRVALLQKEVENFVASTLNQGIIVSSIHNEWFFDDPKLIYVNIEAVDGPLDFARKVRRALRS